MTHKNHKSFRQIFSLIWSVSRSQASYQELQWVRREVQAYFIKVVTLGLCS